MANRQQRGNREAKKLNLKEKIIAIPAAPESTGYGESTFPG